ncbi:MAG TPA: hypothetical protein VLI67_01675 [Vicinamibacteria bacterium]|nr:hypothetical protein [Vicinamibacteria bacterium]
MIQFVLGTLVGGVAAYLWRDRIREYVEGAVPGARDRAVRTLEDLERKSDDVFDRAKSQVGQGLRAGRDKLRSVGTPPPDDEPEPPARERDWR